MREIILGTAGHVDHGKTSLVRALTGIDTDRLKEEKARHHHRARLCLFGSTLRSSPRYH